ncbi:hypothetical protein ACFL6S_37715 [Candidatus Poribacteria bacterium]
MSEKKQPEKKVRAGRISVSLWARSFTRKDGSTVETMRACVQHSRKNRDTDEWNNQQIWMGVDELRDLADTVEQLNIAEEGEESPSSSTKVNHIIGYIKANSLDAGLEVLDVDEKDVSEMLSEFGISTQLSADEEHMVREELRELVEGREFAEAAYMAQCDPFLALIPERGVRRSSGTGTKFHTRGEYLVWLSRFDDIRELRRNPLAKA